MDNYYKHIQREEQQAMIGIAKLEVGLNEKAARLVFLTERQDGLEGECREYKFLYGQQIIKDKPYFLRVSLVTAIERIEKEIRSIRREVDELCGFRERTQYGFTREEIEKAKLYPIEKIVTVDERGFALCINHRDRNPSLYCKEGFCYCFSCGYKADHIGVMMRVRDIGFQDAVKEMI